jgi:hypothetical protein
MPTPKPIKTTQYLKYAFSGHEREENARALARKTQALDEIERKKKQLMADLKAEQETAAAEVQKLARWVNDEYDYRMLDCMWHLHLPRNGMKTLVRVDTGELVEEREMNADELQEYLPFEEGKDADAS